MAIDSGWVLRDIGGSLKENVRDMIYEVTPLDTPIFDMLASAPTNSPFPNWLVTDHTTRSDNAQPENSIFAFDTARQQETRNFNTAQILTKQIRISRSNQRSSHYGIVDLVAMELRRRGMQLKTDIERALARGTQSTGTSGTNRRMDGLIMACSGSSNWTIASRVTLTENVLNTFIRQQWNVSSGSWDILVGGNLKSRISGFTANQGNAFGATALQAGLNLYRDQHDNVIVNTVSQYRTDYGPVNIHLSRDIPSSGEDLVPATILGGDLLIVDRQFLKKLWIDEPFVEKTAKVADGFDAVIITELSLEWGHKNAHGGARLLN